MGENKELFVQALQAAFVAGDPERYGHLANWPVKYTTEERGGEYLMREGAASGVIVTGCSCKAIAESFIEAYL